MLKPQKYRENWDELVILGHQPLKNKEKREAMGLGRQRSSSKGKGR